MTKMRFICLQALALMLSSVFSEAFAILNVQVVVDASLKRGQINPIWRFFGADEPNYAYMKNGKKLLRDLGKLKKGAVYFRTHNLLNTGDGSVALKWGSTNVYTEDAQRNPVYQWNIIDRIFDAYRESGVKPYVQIGFMPKALSTKPNPYRHHWRPDLPYEEIYTGWAYPPKDYERWEELVFEWTKHCISRYGKEAVEGWYWETWNEPNIGYWQGTEEEFHKLHDHAINGVLRALPNARVGGPDAAGSGGDFTRRFITHCLEGTNYATGKKGTPLDFISFHAKGRPVFDNGYVQMNMAQQLGEIEKGFKIVASYPAIKDIPIVIGESDPEGCAACQGDHLGYRNGTMYSSYTAASFVRKLDLAEKHQVNLEGALTWAFEFEHQPLFAGFRALSTGGINKPVLNVFRMFSMMRGQRVSVESDAASPLERIVKESIRDRPDVSAYASLHNHELYLMAWHYHDQDLPGPEAHLHFSLINLPFESGKAVMDTYLVDQDHSNAYTTWLNMGSPQNPTPDQFQALEESSLLERVSTNQIVSVNEGKAAIDLTLKRQGVTLLVLQLQN